jgi:hypothetical protein
VTLLAVELPLPPHEMIVVDRGDEPHDAGIARMAWEFDCLGEIAEVGRDRVAGPVQLTVLVPKMLEMGNLKPVAQAVLDLLTTEKIVEGAESIVDLCVRWSETGELRVELVRAEMPSGEHFLITGGGEADAQLVIADVESEGS